MNAFATRESLRRRRVPKATAMLVALGMGAVGLASCSDQSAGAGASPEASAASSASTVCGPDAASAAATPAPVSPPTEKDRAAKLKIGSILPQTGTLAFLGPPEIAGVDLAVAEINGSDAGVLGGNVEVLHRDSGDTTTDIATQSAQDLIQQKVAAVIGAASSGVSMTFIDAVTGAKIVQISPANTSPDFTDYDDGGYFWRTAPSDVLQGRVNGNLILGDGNVNVGILYLNDAYGTGLRDNIKKAVQDGGGTIVGEEAFNEGDKNFASQIDALLAQDPDAIALIAFDQTKTIIPELVTTKGFPGDKVYFVDGNLADYSKDFDAGVLNCAKGTLPGVIADTDFRARLLGVDPKLTDYSYAAESYDATILAALAAVAANGTTGEDVQSQMQAVSEGGEKCTTFEDCAALLADGTDIDYDGVSGPISFDEKGDPTEAYIGIYQYGADNTYAAIGSEAGQL